MEPGEESETPHPATSAGFLVSGGRKFRLQQTARGAVDFAVAAENSHDWDIAAADILLEETGARLIDASGERLGYNSRQVRRGALLAASDIGAPRLIKGFRAAIGSSKT